METLFNFSALMQAIFLGLIQGLTEFLPISSSGHLTFFETLLGLSGSDKIIFFNVLCHFGTLLAVLVVLRKDLYKLLHSKKEMGFVIAALFPLFFLFPFLKPVKSLFSRADLLGYFFLASGALLYAGSLNYAKARKNFGGAFLVGVFQTIALFPGISRSGATISSARMIGWSYEEALKFSFILSIPTIIGGLALESMEAYKTASFFSHFSLTAYAAAALTSFISGYAALRWILSRLRSRQLRFFSAYCFFAGLLCFLLFSV